MTAPSTWRSFGEALDAYHRGAYAGIGYVFTKDDPYTGVDLDNCLDEEGRPRPREAAWIAQAGSYAEVSPSKKGVKLIVRATLAGPGARKDALGLEIYDSKRFFTITGDILDGCPSTIAEAQGVADEVYQLCGGGKVAGSAAPPISEAPAAMLRRGGPILRPNGQIRRIAAKDPNNWFNYYILGDDGPFLELAAKRGWNTSDSGIRYHGIDVLYGFGFPDDEILLIARAFLPQSQKSRDTARWWAGEVKRCLYGPKGAAVRKPGIPRRASRGVVGFASSTHPPDEAPKRPGRPKVLDADYLLTWYAEEAGKRLLEGPRRLDADALGVSVPTIERLDAKLVHQGAIKIEMLPKRTGRRVILLATAEWLEVDAEGAIKSDPAEAQNEVPSAREVGEAIERTVTPENADLAPQCKGEITGVCGTPPDGGAAPPQKTVSNPSAPPTLRTLVEEAIDTYGPLRKRVLRYVADNGGERFAPEAVERMRRAELERRKYARADAVLRAKAEERGPTWRRRRLRSLERDIAAEQHAGRQWVWLRQYAIIARVHEGRLFAALDEGDDEEALLKEARAVLDRLRLSAPAPTRPRVNLASVAVPGSGGAFARGDARASPRRRQVGPRAGQGFGADVQGMVKRLKGARRAA